VVSNWDCADAIDFNQLYQTIHYKLQLYDYVIVAGFALWQKYLPLPSLHILLEGSTIDQIIKSRLVTKNLQDKETDALKVKENVWPFYQETLKHLSDYKIINVYENGKRVSEQKIINIILNVMDI
jgi:hypothetical protein